MNHFDVQMENCRLNLMMQNLLCAAKEKKKISYKKLAEKMKVDVEIVKAILGISEHEDFTYAVLNDYIEMALAMGVRFKIIAVDAKDGNKVVAS